MQARLALLAPDGREVPAAAAPRLLPDRGLPPGEEIVLVLHTVIPSVQEPLDVRVLFDRQTGAVHASPAGGTGTLLRIWGEDGVAVDPADAGSAGMGILRNWLRHPFLHAELEDDGSVSFASTDVSCWLVSPLLSDGGRPLRLRVAIEGQGGGDGYGAFFYNFRPEPLFTELHSRRGSFPSGVPRELVFDLPVESGSGVRRVRIDPAALPDVVNIRRIAFEAP